ncbi:hypothetical protein K431DRAFT_285401 [Polychaeton citri CBS 116435]|uniref:Zn(2)-C6 fungal-type domain-containing protein n=1 Tax=Polychaeton citri CBS 116435 TaxID=1314669 RepID=A0A9P4Q5H0_9PEZI|nr:hypothetical protein K431DRAFT_285401 [Polychaeton citri CBS 116435]
MPSVQDTHSDATGANEDAADNGPGDGRQQGNGVDAHDRTGSIVSNNAAASSMLSSESPSTFPNNLSSTAAPPRPQVDAHGRTLNPRSCVTCRKRKVKCDKIHPCSNCARAHIDCIFPAPGRAPRKVRKLAEGGRDKELLDRLRRLEGVVKNMGVEVPEREKLVSELQQGRELTGAAGSPESVNVANNTAGSTDSPPPITNGSVNGQGMGRPQWTQRHQSPAQDDEEFLQKTRWVEETTKGRFENRFGRLVINEGKSRYINNSFWANLSNEVEDLKGILNQSDEDSDDESPGQNANVAGAHQGFVFGFASQNVDLLSLHPLPNQIGLYWNMFKENVDPLVKVLHMPSIEPTVLSAASHLNNLSKGFEAILFAIYYGVTTSLTPPDCMSKLGEDRAVLLSRYRFAMEQALARANFLISEEIVVLQAFVIYLMCLRRNSDARVIWTLTGLVVRIAQTMGIHRDGTHFGLTPFEVEMRRRLWWQVCILDTRASEDHGCDPTIIEQAFDTKMPLNINDVDILPNSKGFPPERVGCTDISFCLIRFEVANTFRRINYIPPGPPQACGNFFASVTLEDKEKWITECHQRLEDRYLKHCDMTVPLFWVTATVARLMMSKMWLMVYHPFQRQDGGASLSESVKEKLFITSLENIEYSILLETEGRTMKWGWLFRTYMQWHALAFMLSELCHRTTGELVERAWVAVEKTRDGRWGEHVTDESKAGHLWRPLRKLYRKAKEARYRGLQDEHRHLQQQPTRTYSPNLNPMFGHPRRPQMVRAPLSSAQLQRFYDGPSFGVQPLDTHELMKSPKLSETTVDEDQMEVTNMPALQPTKSQEQEWKNTIGGGLANATIFGNAAQSGYGSHINWGTAGSSRSLPRWGSSFVGGNSPGGGTIDFSYIPSGDEVATHGRANSLAVPNQQQLADFNASLGSGGSLPPNPAFRADSIDSRNLDSIMDTSTEDLNWENWDHLVRQFGMDIDKAGESIPNNPWSGPDSSSEMRNDGASLRFNTNLGGGDWF